MKATIEHFLIDLAGRTKSVYFGRVGESWFLNVDNAEWRQMEINFNE